MSRKRENPKPSSSRDDLFPKRRRPLPPVSDAPSSSPASILVIGLPSDCSVLDLKSRFEIYGSISRTRIDPHGIGFLTFRSISAAQSAVSASLDPSFPITLHSKTVQVVFANDSSKVAQRLHSDAEERTRHTSNLEKPLTRHGRENRPRSAILSSSGNAAHTTNSILDVPFKGRQIVAYDDLL